MKYYKQMENGIITMIGSGSAIHETQTEITKEEYDSLMAVIQNKPMDTFKSVYELKESGIYEGRERTEEEKVQWYVQEVQAGIVAIEDVPVEYQEAVQAQMPQEEVVDVTQTAEYMAGYDQAVLDMINDGIL